ncbi:MAG: type IV pilin-like G/H family protein [Geitlerinemataceae cyanobacterium]
METLLSRSVTTIGLWFTFLGMGNVPVSAQFISPLTGVSPTPDMGLSVPTFSVPIVQAQTPATSSLQERLSGQWRSMEALSGQEELTFIFTPEGQFFFIVRLPNGALAAQEFRYQLHPDSQPPGIDIIFPDGAIVPSILELTPNGQLRFQLDGTDPTQPRPTQFQADADLFDKISDAVTLPAEIVEREVQETLAAFSRSQRTYYLEFRTFAADIEQLYADIPNETENYTYILLPQGDGTESVMMTATARRPDLRSYTTAVFMVPGDRGFPVSVAGTCATDEPSTTPPSMPSPPETADGDILCPSGSSLI